MSVHVHVFTHCLIFSHFSLESLCPYKACLSCFVSFKDFSSWENLSPWSDKHLSYQITKMQITVQISAKEGIWDTSTNKIFVDFVHFFILNELQYSSGYIPEVTCSITQMYDLSVPRLFILWHSDDLWFAAGKEFTMHSANDSTPGKLSPKASHSKNAAQSWTVLLNSHNHDHLPLILRNWICTRCKFGLDSCSCAQSHHISSYNLCVTQCFH